MQQIAERIIFHYPEFKNELQFTTSLRGKDSILISGKSNMPNANLSVSVLPGKTNIKDNDNIFNTLFFKPYLKKGLKNITSLINQPTKAKMFELDLHLLNQKSSKYDWADIISSAAKPTAEFDIGLSIKGTINQSISNVKDYRVEYLSPSSMIRDYSALNKNKEFEFPNMVFPDSTVASFTLMKLPSQPVDMKLYHRIANRKRSYNKIFVQKPSVCQLKTRKIELNDLPTFIGNAIQLDEVAVAGKEKDQLKYKKVLGNASLRGYKITSDLYGYDLLTFIGANGFNVSRYQGEVTITGRVSSSLNGGNNAPMVYVNGRILVTMDELEEIKMDQVDEIYMNPHAVVASINGNMGIIKLYLKQIGYSSNPKAIAKSVTLTEGFAKIENYENPLYLSSSDNGFQQYGVVNWIPTIVTDESGNFNFLIPRTGISTLILHTEGFDDKGRLMSDTQLLATP